MNDHLTKEQYDQLLLQRSMQQLEQQINYHNSEWYLIGKGNYEYFSEKNPIQQGIEKHVIGPINVSGAYHVISIGKEVYNDYLSHKDQQEGLISEQQLPLQPQLQRFMQQLVQSINYNNINMVCYLVGKEIFEHFSANRQVITNVAGPININEEYYLVSNEVYQYQRLKSLAPAQSDQLFLQKYMQQLVQPTNYNGSECFVIGQENHENFLRKFIDKHVIGPINISGAHYIINKEIYDQCQNGQQKNTSVDILQLMQRQVLGPIYYDNIECYVIGNVNYECFLRNFTNQHAIEKLAIGPINVDGECYLLSKEAHNEYLLEKQQENEPVCGNLNSHPQNIDIPNSHNEKNNQQLNDAYQILEKDYNDLQSRYKILEKNYNDLQSQNEKNYNDLQSLEKNYSDLQSLTNNNELLKTNKELRKEVSKYQSALGDATNFHLGNKDANSSNQLSDEIRNLHLKLVKFCGMKKGVEIKAEAKNLLEEYGCSITGETRQHKNLVSGALERKVIETIIEKTKEYFKKDKDSDEGEQRGEEKQENLEANIVRTAGQLTEFTKLFLTSRTGTDEVSKAAPTKLRQQIYSVLGNRGFSNIGMDEKHGEEHPLIVELQRDILDLMDRYREIKDQKKLVENQKINEIIRQVANIFTFRLKVQEPIAEWKWFENKAEINETLMEGPWDENELEDIYVDVCAFPLIGFNFSSDGNEKVIFPAQVVTTNS